MKMNHDSSKTIMQIQSSSIINECIQLKKFNNGAFLLALEDCIQYLPTIFT